MRLLKFIFEEEKTMKKKLLILVVAVMLVLAGCGSKPTLSEWVDGAEVTAAEDVINAQYAGSGLRAEFSADGEDILVFSCIYEEQLDLSSYSQSEIDDAFNTQLEQSGLDSTMGDLFDECEKATGVSLQCIRIQYVNADGTVIYSKDYTK